MIRNQQGGAAGTAGSVGSTSGTISEILSVLRQSKASELAGLVGKLVGVGVFAALIYSYCNVLIEACFRGLK
jgi:hypothetical protein